MTHRFSCKHSADSISAPSPFSSCRSHTRSSKRRMGSLPLCSEVCSVIEGVHVSRRIGEAEGLDWVRPALLTPLVAALVFSAVGDPKYISFLRLTPGVASSVFLSVFWHFEQTILPDYTGLGSRVNWDNCAIFGRRHREPFLLDRRGAECEQDPQPCY
jgi:hypothetical protein